MQATFTGQEYDEENSLQYFGARYMDNEIGKFVSIDPILVKVDSVTKALEDPQALNNYAYSRNNPIVLVDIDGNTYMPFLSTFINKAIGKILSPLIANNPQQSAEIGVGFIPGVGEANDLVETIRGRETITGNELSTSERLITGGATLVPFVGGGIAREALGKGDEFVTLYHGSVNNFGDIMKEGFSNTRRLFLTEDAVDATKYSQKLANPLDPGVVKVEVPKSFFDDFIKPLRDLDFKPTEFKIENSDIIKKINDFIK